MKKAFKIKLTIFINCETLQGFLRGWLLTLQARKSNSMSVDETAKALGVKQQVGYQLVNSRL